MAGRYGIKKNMASLSGKLAIFFWFLILSRVDEVFFLDAAEHLIQILSGFIFRHRQVVEQIVTAVLSRLSRNLALEIGDKLKGTLHQFHDVLALQVALDEEIVACEASHRSPVDNAVLPLLVVAQISGSQVFDVWMAPLCRQGSWLGTFMRISKVVITSPPTSSLRLT